MTENLTPQEILKSKENFARYVTEQAENIEKLNLENYPKQIVHLFIPQLTQNSDGFFKSISEQALMESPYIFWVVVNEKEELLETAKILNYMFKKDCGLFVIKLCLNNDKLEFKTLLKPNLKRQINSETETKKFQQSYWQRYFEICDAEGNSDFQVEPKPQHYQSITIGKSGVQIMQTINTQTQMAASELFITNDIKKDIFGKLYAHKNEIDAEFEDIIWERNEGKKSARVRVLIPTNIMNKENWDNAIKQHILTAEHIEKVMSKYL